MQECLGVSITDKLIRYAKVKKDNDNNFSIESYGLKFYNNVMETLDQIIRETNSTNIPISCDMSNEKYYYFNIFNLTNKTYLEKAIQTEFESFCNENHLNRNAYDGKYIYTNNIEKEDQSKIIYIYDSQNDIQERLSFFGNRTINTLAPLSTSLVNLAQAERNKNSIIINIEENTTITTIVNQAIYSIDTIEEGLKEAIDAINEKENSYSKSYEVLQNTTIYTMETDYSSIEENEYLKYIMPSLFKVVGQIQSLIAVYKKIDNIYITGMGAVINNIDLYFKEYFKDSKVEILKPYFVQTESNSNVNIKDYIEVNSAIAMAMQGLGAGIQTLNFLKRDWKSDLKGLLQTDIKLFKGKNKDKTPKPKKKFSINLGGGLKGKFDKVETILLRNIVAAIMILVIYSIGSIVLVRQIESKISESNDVAGYITQQLNLAKQDDEKILSRTIDYQRYIENLNDISSNIKNTRNRKNQITTLLNKIVYNIPQLVTITSIDNTAITQNGNIEQHISIQVRSGTYEQIAYFKAKLKNANILEDIVSTEGQKSGDSVIVTIEGNLRSY